MTDPLLEEWYKARGKNLPRLSHKEEAVISAMLHAPVIDWRELPLEPCERCGVPARGEHHKDQEGRTS